MTTVQITLPDELAQEAQRAGLLSSESMQELLRRQLKVKAGERLFSLMEKAHAVEGEPMTPEEVAEEIRAMRAERRAQARS